LLLEQQVSSILRSKCLPVSTCRWPQLVPHDTLIERFRAAVEGYERDARAERLPDYIRHLHQIERDYFGLGPTNIEIPARPKFSESLDSDPVSRVPAGPRWFSNPAGIAESSMMLPTRS
jgi:hypothetical protein